jgi:uncharacterized membrane protein
MSQRTAAFALLLAWCAALLAARVWRAGTLMYLFLGWTLVLAAIPALAASQLRRERASWKQAGWLAVWLAFLPNAPYLVTDFVHLRARPPVPLWFDIALLISCAATGLLLGYVSVADVQRFIARQYGEATAWLCAASALVLSGAGIYLGRFLRWNSWDILANPVAIALSIQPRVVSVTLVYGFGLVVGYLAFHTLSAASGRAASDPRSANSRNA